MKKKRAILILVCALLVPAPPAAEATGDMFGVMFRMMLAMMNVMSDVMLGNTSDFGMGSGNTFGLGMTAMPMMSRLSGMNSGMPVGGPWSGMGGSPWSNPGSGPGTPPWGAPGRRNAWHAPANANYGPPRSLLEGRWYGQTGDVLEVRGNRFRLANRRSGINGTIRIENNIVHLISPQTGSISRYTFLRNQSELMLQDASGQVLGFRQRRPNRAAHVF